MARLIDFHPRVTYNHGALSCMRNINPADGFCDAALVERLAFSSQEHHERRCAIVRLTAPCGSGFGLILHEVYRFLMIGAVFRARWWPCAGELSTQASLLTRSVLIGTVARRLSRVSCVICEHHAPGFAFRVSGLVALAGRP